MSTRVKVDPAKKLLDQLVALRAELAAAEKLPARIHRRHQASAKNLQSYVQLRRHDLRPIQDELAKLGLSSLGRSEAHVLGTFDAVIFALQKLTDAPAVVAPRRSVFTESQTIVDANAALLLGPTANPERDTRIMVTLPSEAATDSEIVREILNAGAEILRINTAHDDRAAWAKMIRFARGHEKKLGRRVGIAMDLGGPKLRVEEIRNKKGESKNKILVTPGDAIRIVNRTEQFNKKSKNGELRLEEPAIFEAVEAGHRVFIDDGAIGGIVDSVGDSEFVIRINAASTEGTKIALEKGINLPDSNLRLPALSDADRANLPFVAENADIVNLSFVRTVEDVNGLKFALQELGAEHLGIVLKIELVEGFQNLPELLLAAMQWERCGVMIARGDLAIEAGYLRLAEMQEEILWLCEAAHVPVIWATEVLSNLSKTGHPSRAEVTDAAMSGRAECVMLNKGEYITRSVSFLDTVLERMGEHQHKKKALLRKLKSWS
jgi:pyruvate kinase